MTYKIIKINKSRTPALVKRVCSRPTTRRPKKLKVGRSSYNHRPSKKPTTPLLVIFEPVKEPIVRFDSYALTLSVYAFNTFAITYSRSSLQKLLFAVCCHYCLCFFYSCLHGYSFLTNIHHLKQMLNVNTYVQKFINDFKFVLSLFYLAIVLVNVAN